MKKLSLIVALAMIFTLCAVLCACQDSDDYVLPELDGGSMKMLCFTNVDSLENIRIRTYDSRVDGGFSAAEGLTCVERPTVHQYFIAYSEELGSPYTLPWVASSYKDSFMLSADFYAFEGEISKLAYEYTYFDTESLFNCTVRIYNGSELVGKLFFDPYVFISRDWIESFVGELENILVCVNISRATSSVNPVCLSLGNVEDSELCSHIVDYFAEFSGGWHTEFWKSSCESTASTVQMSFIGSGALAGNSDTENLISLTAEFYDLGGELTEIRAQSDALGQIKIFDGERLVGLVNYTSDQPIDADVLKLILII